MKSIRFVSLGCPKNLVDSEVMLGKLRNAGYAIVPDGNPADIFIVNTCCFIKEATEESEDIIKQALALKEAGKYKKVIVAGCLPQRNSAREEIDGWLGVFGRDKIVQVCEKLSDHRSVCSHVPLIPKSARVDERTLRITSRHYAYLRIAEGCDNRCTYCIIPRLHGHYRSKPIKAVLEEAAGLVRQGAVEINLIAQDTTSYGVDLYGKPRLAELLRKLSKIKAVKWLRLLYTHPRHFTEELIEEIADNKKVVKYIDMPLQHISDKILKKMRRGISSRAIRRLIARLRQRIPGLFLRTAVIVGFPGETEDDFRELVDFIKEAKFERLGAFKYSQEENTPAGRLPNQTSEPIKARRLDAVMKTQQEIAFMINRRLKGKVVEIIADEINGQKVVGRTYGDAPEVDGNIFVKGKGFTEGKIYKVKIVGYRGYDLTGVKI